MTTSVLVWDDGFSQRELDDPTTADLRSCLAALNGLDKTLVTVYRDGAHLAVGGSAAKGLVAYCTLDGETFWQLISDVIGPTVTVTAGGQAGQYPSECVTTLADATTAASEFLGLGVLAGGLRWRKE